MGNFPILIEKISHIVDAVLIDPIASLFASAILFFWLIGIEQCAHFKDVENNKRQFGVHLNNQFNRYLPSALITIGVSGTFVGIFIGLLDFKIGDIQTSVATLLQGLKISFSTSIVGMLSSLTLKMLQILTQTFVSPHNKSSHAEEIREAIVSLNKQSMNSDRKTQELLTKIDSGVSGDQDGSVINWLKTIHETNISGSARLTADMNKNFEQLNNEIQTFSKNQSQDSSDALTSALSKVMEDFNSAINDRLGKSFENLSVSTNNLVKWQENFADGLQVATSVFNETVTQLKTVSALVSEASASIASVSNDTKTIPKNMKSLETVLNGLDRQIADLHEGLNTLGTIRDDAGDVFPAIKGNIEDLTKSFSVSVIENNEKIRELLEEQSNSFQRTHNRLNTSIESAQNNTSEIIQKSFETFDSAMEQEIKRVIEKLGSELASLSNKFVEDYGPLTNKLRKIVEIAELGSTENKKVGRKK